MCIPARRTEIGKSISNELETRTYFVMNTQIDVSVPHTSLYSENSKPGQTINPTAQPVHMR